MEHIQKIVLSIGVFLLYCKDHFDEKTTNKAKNDVIIIMEDRGFSKMKKFSEALFAVSSQNPNEKIEKWYPKFLEYLEKNNL